MTPEGPQVLGNALGETLTPSVVALADDGTTLVGAPARARAHLVPERSARSFKRDMGTERVLRLGDRTLRPQELSALVLAALKRDAEVALDAPVEEAVITVPAYFGDLQRQATRDAASIAGLNVERLLNEPTAAALAYGLHNKTATSRIAVLDLGGGTFDVTVLEIIEGVIEIQSSAGDVRLGGDDFDDALAEVLARRVQKSIDVDDRRVRARLREHAERARIRLSTEERTRVALVDLEAPGGGRASIEIEISRVDAETSFGELLDRMRAPIDRALRDAKKKAQAIDEVLLVGGATRMPCVARLAAQIFGRVPTRKLPPDEAVALGAAVQAALKSNHAAVEDIVVTDVAPFTLGVSTADRVGDQIVGGVFSPVLERGTVIPASREKRFYTLRDEQTEIKLGIYQGEHALCQDNQKLGEYTASGIPKATSGEQAVDVRFTYDLNGLLEVDVRIVATGKTGTLLIERSPGALTEAQLRSARATMKSLKLHPRDALPNTTAIARADAVHVELTGAARAQMAHEIAVFRAALDEQDPDAIEAARARLVRITNELRAR
jgi:molecular chaperone HscC